MENNWEFHHIALIVKDISKAVKHFESIGAVVTKPIAEGGWDKDHLSELELNGKTPKEAIKLKWAHVKLGGVTIEFHQPVSGESPWKEYLARRGEGIDHVSYIVDDLEKEKAKMVKKGFPVIYAVKDPDGTLADVYFDTRKTGNIVVSAMRRGIM